MHKHRTPEGLEEHALIDRAVLNLMLDLDRQRPWAEDEIARAISIPGDVRESLRRLRACKLIHRWNDLAIARAPAVRFHEITQAVDASAPATPASAIRTKPSSKVCSRAAPTAKGRAPRSRPTRRSARQSGRSGCRSTTRSTGWRAPV